MSALFGDLAYALRTFRSARVFAATAVLTLALGIGGTTAIFTLMHALMLKSLPVTDPSRLYRIGDGSNCGVQGGPQLEQRKRKESPTTLNLLMNAIDATATMPAVRRRVRICTTRRDAEVRLAVEDSGVGIDADRLSEVFEPFYTTKSAGSGMGMGLAIARNIVEAHAGRMGAENNVGGGATVWFSVPLSPGRQS